MQKQKITNEYAVYNNDCCVILPKIPDNSVGYSIFSPPFCSLYSYSDSQEDMGNSRSYNEFFEHFTFLIEQLHRVTIPGRNVSIHCMNLPIFKGETGYIGLRDFPGRIVKAFQKIGFIYHSHHVIWKDPLLAAVRTKAIGLAHKQVVKDSALIRAGIPDEIVTFRKRGDNPKPIEHKKCIEKYHGSRKIPKELYTHKHKIPRNNKYSHWIWQQYASPVWFDIRQTKVLRFREARGKDDEKHICPLQLDTIERCIELWSTEGDIVLSPFMGVGSEIYVAVKNGRKGLGIELKENYYKQALKNIQRAKTHLI